MSAMSEYQLVEFVAVDNPATGRTGFHADHPVVTKSHRKQATRVERMKDEL
jgi:hypothetical protein